MNVLGRSYDSQTCSVAGSLALIGERWTLLLIRDAFMGARRFEDFQRSLGVARNILTARLNRLVEEGLFRRVRYQEHPDRYEYRLTEKGIDLWPVIITLMKWGDRHLYPGREPVVLSHKQCGGTINDRRICERCGTELGPRDVAAFRQAGAPATGAPATGAPTAV